MTLRAKLDKRNEEELANLLPGSPGGLRTDRELLPGVTIGNLDPDSRAAAGVGDEVDGIVVTGVETESKAAAAGLAEGDVIIEVNRQAIRNVRDAVAVRSEHDENRRLLLRIVGGGRSRLLTVDPSE